MSRKPIRLRELASRDVELAADYYSREAGPDVALRFIGEIEAICRTTADHPKIGSPRYAVELSLPALRTFRVKRYPFLIFYIEQENNIEIWRVLHAERDIPTTMRLFTD